MPLHLPTFLTRTGSAIVFGIIMLAGLLWNDVAFIVLMAVIQFLCIKEYFGLISKIHPDARIPNAIIFITLTIGLFLLGFLFYWIKSQMPLKDLFILWLAIFAIPLLLLLGSILRKGVSKNIFSLAFLGVLYISLPVEMLLLLRVKSIILPIALILMIWTNDTMAYIVGSFIGKTPFSKISPKKTWEGTLGGIILTVVGAAIWGYYSGYYDMLDWIIFALIAGIAGTAGDLLESKLKRLAGVKDSGAIMPGHGGALDRFDSLLLATPFAFAYAYLFMPPIPLVIF